MISSHVVHFQTFKSNFYKANSKLKNKSVKKIISIGGRITSTVFKKKIICEDFLKMHASLNITRRMTSSWNTNVVLLVSICQIYLRSKSEKKTHKSSCEH